MKKQPIVWKQEGWTSIQNADAQKHLLEITCRAENGIVVEVRIRHNDGENEKGQVLFEGNPALPMGISKFAELYESGKLEIR